MDINKQQRNPLYRQKVLTVSAGICSIPYAASNMKQLMDNADLALYQAKRSGKNKVVIYSIGEVRDDRANAAEGGTRVSGRHLFRICIHYLCADSHH